MSFWSKIGLADKDAINKLQEEIISLREENQRLAESKDILLKSYIDEQTKNIFEAIRNYGDAMTMEIIRQCQKVSVSYCKSIEELKALLNEMNSKLLSSVSSLDSLTTESINGLGDSIESSLSKSEKEVERIYDMLTTVSDSITLLTNETEEIKPAYEESITKLVKLSNQLREETSSMDKEIQDKIEKLGESIVNLWKIMKVVFIESSLNEIDKL